MQTVVPVVLVVWLSLGAGDADRSQASLCEDAAVGSPEAALAMEALVDNEAVEVAYEALLYYPKRPASDPRPGAMTKEEKDRQAMVLYASGLKERAYRLRAEAKLSAERGQPSDVTSQAEQRYERERGRFCTFVGHLLLPELRPDLLKKHQDPTR